MGGERNTGQIVRLRAASKTALAFGQLVLMVLVAAAFAVGGLLVFRQFGLV